MEKGQGCGRSRYDGLLYIGRSNYLNTLESQWLGGVFCIFKKFDFLHILGQENGSHFLPLIVTTVNILGQENGSHFLPLTVTIV